MPSPYFVGGSQQFQHAERDPSGNPIAQQAGVWSLSNPGVGAITQAGLATWSAPGETLVLFVIQAFKKFGALDAVIHTAPPVSLTLTPSTVTCYAGSVTRITVTGTDALSNPVTDLTLTSVSSSDPAVADVVQIDRVGLDAPEFLVVGVSEGVCTITVFVGVLSAQALVDVLHTGIPTGLSQADADARYRQLSVVIPDSEISKVPRVDKPDASGAVTYTWLRTERAMHMKLVGDTVATIEGLPVGEFMYFDVDTGTGGHALSFIAGTGLPAIEPDNNIVPQLSLGANVQDSFMLYHEGPRIVLSKTWLGIPTT